MSEAEKAFAEAERMIAEARENGADELNFDLAETRALERLPGGIGDLMALRSLDLDNTQVSDLGPLSGLTGLTMLALNDTQVSDLGPLSGLTGLTTLRLDDTAVSYLDPLSGLKRLTELWLDNTAVSDLRPIRVLRGLVENPSPSGLTFGGCAAAQSDFRIAEIAKITNDSHRARVLFDYLEDWVPPEEVEKPKSRSLPTTPAPGLAPLQAEVRDGRLVRVGRHGLPEQDAMARAEAGWQALKAYRDVFGKACNTHNYGQLRAVLDGFDAAMGEAFEPDRMILIGTMGSAIVALSEDAAFAEELPTGAPALLIQFGVQIETFINRFPDWVAYREEAQGSAVTVAAVEEEGAAFGEIETELQGSAQTDAEVAEDYAVQVEAGTRKDSDPAVSKGLVDSTREVTRILSEQAIAEMQSGRPVQREIDEMDKVHDGELAKVKWYAGGWAVVMLRRRSGPLRRLATRFPGQLGWLHRVLDYIGPEADR